MTDLNSPFPDLLDREFKKEVTCPTVTQLIRAMSPYTQAPPHPLFLLCFVWSIYYGGHTSGPLSSFGPSGQAGRPVASLLVCQGGCKVTRAGEYESYLKNYKVQYKKLKITMKLILYLTYLVTLSAHVVASWWLRTSALENTAFPNNNLTKTIYGHGHSSFCTFR